MKKIEKKYIILSVTIIALIAGSFLLLSYLKNSDDNSSSQPINTEQSTSPTENNNSDDSSTDQVPTQQKEKQAGSDTRTQPSPATNGLKKVTPIITSWGQVGEKYQVASRVPGVLEDGGICTLTMTKNTQSVTASKTGTSNVSEVSCGYIGIDMSKLTSGNWTAIVNYKSKTAEGVSNAVTVSVK